MKKKLIISLLFILAFLIHSIAAEEKDVDYVFQRASEREKEIKESVQSLLCDFYSRVDVNSMRGNDHFRGVEIYHVHIDSGKVSDSILIESEREGDPGERDGSFLSSDTEGQFSTGLVSNVISNLTSAKKYELMPSTKQSFIDGRNCYVVDYIAEYEGRRGGEVHGTIWIDGDDYSVRKHEMEFKVSVVVASAAGKMTYKYLQDIDGIPLLTGSTMSMEYRRFLRRGNFNLKIENYDFNIKDYEKADH